MKYITWIVVIVVLVWAGWAIAHRSSTPTPVAETGPIKIGFLSPLSGDAAAYGEPGRNVTELAVKEINDAGGINGRQVEVIYEDGKCDGATAVSATQKLINVDKVQAIIGGFCSSESLAAVPVAEGGKVFLFSPGSSSPDLTGRSPFFARDYPSDASQGAVLAQVAKDMGWKKVAFIQETKDYPLGIFKAFDAAFTALGGATVKEEFPAEATDFRTQLTKLKAANADALFIDTQTPAAGARIAKQLQDLKWTPHLILSDAISGDPKTISDNAKVFEGALAAEFGTDPSNPKFQALVANYKAKYGADVPFLSYAQTEYDAVYIIADGVKAVGYDGAKLTAWARTITNWEGASGMVTIGADGDRVGGHTPKIVKNGKVELLHPAATTTPAQ